jgi:hypothetical protein
VAMGKLCSTGICPTASTVSSEGNSTYSSGTGLSYSLLARERNTSSMLHQHNDSLLYYERAKVDVMQ